MGFKQHKVLPYVTFHDLPHDGAPATVIKTRMEEVKNFRTGDMEPRPVLEFLEFKELTCTNKNIDLLDESLPHLDLGTLAGHQVWLMPVVTEVAGDEKQIVRIDKLKTMQLQGQPSAPAQPTAGIAATPSDNPPTDLNEPPSMQEEIPPADGPDEGDQFSADTF